VNVIRYRPKLDRMFWILVSVTNLLLLFPILLLCFDYSGAIWILVASLLFLDYFFVSSLFGYAELREDSLFIKYGFILKKTIPYNSIRGVKIERKWYSEAMLSLKNSIEHVTVKYNRFDFTAISVKNNEAFAAELSLRANL